MAVVQNNEDFLNRLLEIKNAVENAPKTRRKERAYLPAFGEDLDSKISEALANGQDRLTDNQIEAIRSGLADWHKPRQRNNTAIRVILNILPNLFTAGLFEFFYVVFNKLAVGANKLRRDHEKEKVLGGKVIKKRKFRWDWSKSIKPIGRSFTAIKEVGQFLNDTKEFKADEVEYDSEEAQKKARLEAEAQEKARLEAEAQEKARLEAEAQEKARLEAEAQEKARLEAEAQEKARLEAEAQEKARLAAEAEQKDKELVAEIDEILSIFPSEKVSPLPEVKSVSFEELEKVHKVRQEEIEKSAQKLMADYESVKDKSSLDYDVEKRSSEMTELQVSAFEAEALLQEMSREVDEKIKKGYEELEAVNSIDIFETDFSDVEWVKEPVTTTVEDESPEKVELDYDAVLEKVEDLAPEARDLMLKIIDNRLARIEAIKRGEDLEDELDQTATLGTLRTLVENKVVEQTALELELSFDQVNSTPADLSEINRLVEDTEALAKAEKAPNVRSEMELAHEAYWQQQFDALPAEEKVVDPVVVETKNPVENRMVVAQQQAPDMIRIQFTPKGHELPTTFMIDRALFESFKNVVHAGQPFVQRGVGSVEFNALLKVLTQGANMPLVKEAAHEQPRVEVLPDEALVLPAGYTPSPNVRGERHLADSLAIQFVSNVGELTTGKKDGEEKKEEQQQSGSALEQLGWM